MCYTLSISHNHPQTLSKIQSAPIRVTLIKLGFKRTTSHAIVFGSQRYGGLRLRDLPTEQGIAQTILLLRHLRAQTDVGRLALISLQWLQLIASTSKPILEYTSPPLPHLNADWFITLRAFLHSINA